MPKITKPPESVKFYLGESSSPGSLVDLSSRGKPRPWAKNKTYSVYLAQSYARLQEHVKAGKIFDCGSWLKFSQCPSGHAEGQRLIRASFCRQRLCPLCAWRRSLLVAGQVQQICHELHQERPVIFLMLTLTLRNCSAEQLPITLSHLVASYSRFIKYKPVRDVLLGSFRAIEVTVSKTAGYHPHIHALLAVPSTYFKSGYLTQDYITSLWAKALKADYQPVVHIQRVKPSKGISGASAEVAKYTLKPGEYINPVDPVWTDQQVGLFNDALKGRRSYAFTGVLKEIYRRLFGDADLEGEDADLVAAPVLERCTCPVCQSDLSEHVFRWSWAAKDYLGS